MFQAMAAPVGEDVKDLFTELFRRDKYGVIKIIFQEDELRVGSFKEFTQSCDQDIESVVLPLLEDDANCYILYRLGFPGSREYLWVYLAWFPKNSPTGEKMKFGSLSDTLKEEFRSNFIFDEFSPETKDEVVSGFERILANWQKRN